MRAHSGERIRRVLSRGSVFAALAPPSGASAPAHATPRPHLSSRGAQPQAGRSPASETLVRPRRGRWRVVCRTAIVGAMLALSSVLPAVVRADTTLDDAVMQIEARYATLNDLKASFDQTAFNKSLNQSIPAQGAVYLKKGGKMRWEYSTPTPQQIVSDGKTIWVYTPELKQVNVGEAPRVLAGPAGSFLAGLGKLRAHFTVKFQDPAKKTDAAGNYVLDLKPRKPEPSLSRLVISVDPREYLVRTAQVFDQFDNTVTMTFTRIAPNSGLSDKLFAFVPPKGVSTIPFESR